MRAFIAVAIICGITAAVMSGLWSIRDQHYGISNICAWYHPNCQ